MKETDYQLDLQAHCKTVVRIVTVVCPTNAVISIIISIRRLFFLPRAMALLRSGTSLSFPFPLRNSFRPSFLNARRRTCCPPSHDQESCKTLSCDCYVLDERIPNDITGRDRGFFSCRARVARQLYDRSFRASAAPLIEPPMVSAIGNGARPFARAVTF